MVFLDLKPGFRLEDAGYQGWSPSYTISDWPSTREPQAACLTSVQPPPWAEIQAMQGASLYIAQWLDVPLLDMPKTRRSTSDTDAWPSSIHFIWWDGNALGASGNLLAAGHGQGVGMVGQG
ncbi:hypothetical protein FQN49_000649 [Arthroderma sp. PD_2]|nr:hypothetical protein FQN49_000649 [Arthroderma sp. PD_2]